MFIHCFSHFLVAFLLNVYYISSGSLGIYFNATGYEDCVFNLAKYDPIPDKYSSDVIEEILVYSKAVQRWNILQLESKYQTQHGQVFNETSLERPNYLKESCSVNIVVSVRTCFQRIVNEVFGPRMYSTENTLLMILGDDLPCSTWEMVGHAQEWPHVIDILIIPITKHIPEVVYNFCYRCPGDEMFMRIPANGGLQNIQDMKRFSNKIRARSTLPIIALISKSTESNYTRSYYKKCIFLYKLRPGTQPSRIGCHEYNIVMENIAKQHNSTLEYFTLEDPIVRDNYLLLSRAPKHFYAIAALGLFNISGAIFDFNLQPISFYKAVVLA